MAESVGGVASRGRVGSDIVRFCVAVNINNRPSELSVSMGSNSALDSNAQALSTPISMSLKRQSGDSGI